MNEDDEDAMHDAMHAVAVVARRASWALDEGVLMPVRVMLHGDSPANSPIVAMILLSTDEELLPPEEDMRQWLLEAAEETLSYE